MSYGKEWIDIDCRIEHKTASSILVESDYGGEAWIPISLIYNWDDDWGPGDTVSIDIPVSIAEERGLV